MAKSTPDCIVLLGDAATMEAPLEAPTVYGGEITPGMLIERTAAGTVQPCTKTTTPTAKLFAVEMGIDGRGIDDVYDVGGEAVLMHSAKPGDHIYALLSAGENVSIGENLASTGDGALNVSDTASVAVALEAIDNDPGTNGLPVRIKVEVL